MGASQYRILGGFLIEELKKYLEEKKMFSGLKCIRKVAKFLLVLFCISIFLPGMPLFLKSLIDSAVSAGEGEYTVSDAVYKTVSYYVYNKNQLDNWEEVWALKGAGEDLGDGRWTLPDWKIDELILESSDARDYARKIIGIYLAGEDPGNINDRDLISELKSKQKANGSFGENLNSTYWAIIALNLANADESYDKVLAIDYLINQQNIDGGFSSASKGNFSEADATGAVLLALSTSPETEGVSECVTRAFSYLNSVQMDNGAFAYDNTETAESTAYAIIGLVANGEDITAEKWIKNGKTMIDALIGFQLGDGSFSHSLRGPYDKMATRQALLALSYLMHEYPNYVITNDEITPEDQEIKPEIRVRIEGRTSTLFDEMIEVTDETKGIELLRTAIGEENIVTVESEYGIYISSLLGETADGDNYWGLYTITNNELSSASEGIAGLSLAGIDELLLHFKNLYITKDAKIAIEADGLKTKITVKKVSETWIQDPDTKEWSSTTTEDVVEGATVRIDDQSYITDEHGQVSVQLPAGTYTTRVEKQGETYPELIRSELSFLVEEVDEPGSGTPSPAGISARVAVVGKDGRLLFGPSSLRLATDSSVLDALDGTGLNYSTRDGYVSEIAGQRERELGSQSGWKYKVNSSVPSANARDYKLNDGDRLIWYYAKDANDLGPSWSELTEALRTGEPIQTVTKVSEKTGDEIVKEQIDKEKEIVISFEDREKPFITLKKETVQKIIDSNKPLVIKNAGAEVYFEPQSLLTEEITKALANENTEIKIEVKEIDISQSQALLEEIKQKNGKFVDVLGKIFEFSFKIQRKNTDDSVTEENITEFNSYLPIKIDLSQAKVKDEIKHKLTAVRYELDEAGNYVPVKLGGTYDSQEKTFTFYTDSFSLYGVMEADELSKISLGINKPVTLINGQESWTDVPATIINNRTMVPIRLIAEGLGAQVEWLKETNTVNIKSDSIIISLTIGQLLAGMDTPAMILNYRTMVPLRYISENLGARVMWFAATQTIEIIK